MYQKYSSAFVQRIQADAAWFSDVAVTGTPVKALIAFLHDNPAVYAFLTDAARVPIAKYVEHDDEQFAVAHFLSPNAKAHVEALVARKKNSKWFILSGQAFRQLYRLAKDERVEGLLLDFGIDLFGSSGNYDTVNTRFDGMIQPHLDEFSAAQLQTLLALIEVNRQCNDRGRAAADHTVLKALCDRVLGAAFDYGPYPKFLASVPAPPAPAGS